MSAPADLIEFRSDFDVDLIDVMGGDQAVCQAARVSTQGTDSIGSEASEGLIDFLMRNRHGSPFEHLVFKWRVSAPIFVFREFQRHRIASYNEESGRYRQLEPVFYVPAADRPLTQVGKPGEYTFEPGSPAQHALVQDIARSQSLGAYEAYTYLLEHGVAKEVARQILPLNIYSSMYVTMNARALMNFLSLRIHWYDSTFPSFPMYEIEEVAMRMDADFRTRAPLTHKAFLRNGKVAP